MTTKLEETQAYGFVDLARQRPAQPRRSCRTCGADDDDDDADAPSCCAPTAIADRLCIIHGRWLQSGRQTYSGRRVALSHPGTRAPLVPPPWHRRPCTEFDGRVPGGGHGVQPAARQLGFDGSCRRLSPTCCCCRAMPTRRRAGGRPVRGVAPRPGGGLPARQLWRAPPDAAWLEVTTGVTRLRRDRCADVWILLAPTQGLTVSGSERQDRPGGRFRIGFLSRGVSRLEGGTCVGALCGEDGDTRQQYTSWPLGTRNT